MRSKGMGFFLALLTAMVLGAACAPAPTPTPAPKVVAPLPTPTPTPEPFFEGKTLRIIVSFAPGGPTDLIARNTARFIGKYVPGNPTVIVENMAGAGGLTAANYLYKVSKPDGLTMTAFEPGLIMQQLLGGPGVEYDARKFNPVGAHVKNTSVCVVRADTGLKTFEALVASPKPIALGGTAPGIDSVDFPKLLKEVLGANIKLVEGYGGLAPINVAIEGGELDGSCATWGTLKTLKPEWLEKGFVNALVQFAPRKHPELPAVPLATELAKTEEARQILRAREAILGWHHTWWLPPGVPPERVKLLREAFMKTMKDTEFLAEAGKQKLEIDPTPGEEVVKRIEELFATPPDLVKKLGVILVPK